nr:hypothetical protein [Methylorubrum sp. Q1]
MVDDCPLVRENGLALFQIPGGIEGPDGPVAHLVVARAAQSNTQTTVLSCLTRRIQDEAVAIAPWRCETNRPTSSRLQWMAPSIRFHRRAERGISPNKKRRAYGARRMR